MTTIITDTAATGRPARSSVARLARLQAERSLPATAKSFPRGARSRGCPTGPRSFDSRNREESPYMTAARRLARPGRRYLFKGLQPIMYAGKEVWPLIEGGK